MRDDARSAEPGDDAVGQIAGALGGAAGHYQHVAFEKRAPHRRLELRIIVRDRAEKDRIAAVLIYRSSDDRAVGIVDRGGAQRRTRLHQFVTGRDDGNARPARDADIRDAACRQNADLARADHRSGPQQGLAAGDVGPGVGDELSGRNGAAHLDAGAARRLRAAGRDRRRRSRQHRLGGRGAARDRFVVEHEPHRGSFARRGQIDRADGKPVDIGTVEGRHVERRHHIVGERAAERIGKPALLPHGRARKQRGLKPSHGFFARQDRQELVLLTAVAVVRGWSLGHLPIHVIHAIDRHRPACLPQILRWAPGSAATRPRGP